MKNLSYKELTEKEHFDKMAEVYDNHYHYGSYFAKYKIRKKSRSFLKLLKTYSTTENLSMLEIGSGTGEYTKYVAKLFPKSKIVGLDLSERVLAIARHKCKRLSNVSFILSSAYDTGFKTNCFDIVFGFYILHHLDLTKARKEIFRILKPGGFAFFYEPNILNPIVYLIKRSRLIKKLIGDSPGEMAINPLEINRLFKDFKLIELSMSEYILPVNIFSGHFNVKIDKATRRFKNLPLIKYLGGSVEILVQKKIKKKRLE